MPATLNPYVWEMYLASFSGQLALEYFERLCCLNWPHSRRG